MPTSWALGRSTCFLNSPRVNGRRAHMEAAKVCTPRSITPRDRGMKAGLCLLRLDAPSGPGASPLVYPLFTPSLVLPCPHSYSSWLLKAPRSSLLDPPDSLAAEGRVPQQFPLSPQKQMSPPVYKLSMHLCVSVRVSDYVSGRCVCPYVCIFMSV